MTPIKSKVKYDIIEHLDDEGRDLIVEMKVSPQEKNKNGPKRGPFELVKTATLCVRNILSDKCYLIT